MLETRQMPPVGMPAPAEAERAQAVSWIRASLGRIRRGPRRRSGTGHGPAVDERRIRVRDPRPHRGRGQGRRRRVERLGGGRGLRELRRRPVRAGRRGRALPGGGEAGRRPRGHRVGSPGLLHRSREDGPRAVGAREDQRALPDERVPRRLGRGRPSLRLRALRQGVLRGLVLQAPRGPRRSGGDLARPRGEGRHHGPLRRAHLRGGQPDRRRIPEPRHDRRLAEDRGADRGHRGVDGAGPDRGRRPHQEAGHLAELVLRARRPRGGGRRRREPPGVRRHHPHGPVHARVHLSAQPALQPTDAGPAAHGRDRLRAPGRCT